MQCLCFTWTTGAIYLGSLGNNSLCSYLEYFSPQLFLSIISMNLLIICYFCTVLSQYRAIFQDFWLSQVRIVEESTLTCLFLFTHFGWSYSSWARKKFWTVLQFCFPSCTSHFQSLCFEKWWYDDLTHYWPFNRAVHLRQQKMQWDRWLSKLWGMYSSISSSILHPWH